MLKGTNNLIEPGVSTAVNDDELMSQVAAGKSAVLGELYIRHRKMVHSAIRRFAPAIPEAQVEELGQDIFVLLYKKAGRYQGQGRFRAYLYGIAVKQARTWQRNHAIRCRILGKTPPETFVPEQGMQNCPSEQVALRETVVQMLSRLPGKQRDVLVLHSVEGFSGDEIAEILKISPQTVRSRLFRARQTILENVNITNWAHSLQRESR